ncbi:sulfatase [Croceitalea marina]|uniref:Sulfatase n=1 Tax=Croceitalea marina TaxID=1775166 RepID=A0ABW5MQ79_9FLAO
MNLQRILFSLGLVLTFFSCKEKPKEETSRPNLVLIIADDMNWNDSGAYGNPVIRTPNIDKLAKEGMLFSNAFLNTSSCSPSRTSIISGKYPHNTDAEQLHWPLPEGHRTFVEELKKAGYWTGLGGKYHLGDAVKNHFDSIIEVGTAGFQLGADGKQQKLNGDGSGCESWVSLVKARKEETPFFLWLAAVDPHRPYYEGVIDEPHSPEKVIVPPYFPDTPKVRKDLALYYDEISRMDKYIGDVVAELDRQGVSENTMILFISDNGRPFPRDKTTLYEGGIKTPWIVKWPKNVVAGTRNKNLVSAIDIAPTFLKMAGLEALDEFEGLDFSPMLKNLDTVVHQEIYAEDHWHDYEDYTRAIRTDSLKYIRNFYPDLPNTPSADAFRGLTYQSMLEQKDANLLNEAQMRCFIVPRPEEELYDVTKDPNELNNLAMLPEYKSALNDLRKRMAYIRKKSKDVLPKTRTPDDFDRETGLPTDARIRPRPSKAEMFNATNSK